MTSFLLKIQISRGSINLVKFYTFSRKHLLQTFVVFSPLSVHLPQDNNFVGMESEWTAQRSKNTTHLYMHFDAKIDDLIKVSKQRQ